ncbi:hypothetical protein VAPA_2c03990 [Variovorax paradoxus B4]|uniref:Uncharacterized protein n=1 Tax=Variovorax paradoxus B4 TaxID=1246301 RepID=T1XKX8_VARPD|nr:hypothetical protein [Variovorax paradoxus]AGU52959.1 hypothetical protein VAPA_2c03990 [Variovorax paradoxus B4]
MFEILYRLSRAKLPVTVAGPRQIEKIRRLDAAGYIRAFIPASHVDCDNCLRQDPATVLDITPLGRSILSRGSEAKGISTMHRVSVFARHRDRSSGPSR